VASCDVTSSTYRALGVGWVRQHLLPRMKADFCVDADRVYAAGFSNGGMFTYNVGVDMASDLAAVVPIAGSWHPGYGLSCIAAHVTS